MRRVIYIDKRGWKRAAMVRDSDPDEAASKIGIPCNPPDIEGIDWEAVKRDINNLLVERGMFTWGDILRTQSNLRSVIQDVLFRPLIALFRNEDKEGK